ncbi:MAG: hypothetical protein LBN30_10625 [Oscillospiraceae bacterium]|jgi:X-X-X-Leu-X-X-Gly heptad repeat protein|nr:hypothetical protein [Oscillospiraceae bacterium]
MKSLKSIKKFLKSLVGLAIAAALLLTCSLAFAAPEDDVAEEAVPSAVGESFGGKEEVVYASLTPTGRAEAVYIVNIFNALTAGGLTDYGDYSAVKNLTDLATLDFGGGAVNLNFTEPQRFYYQGNAVSAALPWDFAITYSLNGQQTLPEILAGKSGRVEISIKSTVNAAYDSYFADSYMLQITVPLDTEIFKNITAQGATEANSGRDKLLNFTVLPGTNANLRISADVTEFELGAIEIAALPFSMDITLPDLSALTDGFDQLTDAVSQLSDGVTLLSDGATELRAGAEELSSGAVSFTQGLTQLDGGTDALNAGSSQINAALQQVAAGLGAVPDLSGLAELGKLPPTLTTLADGLDKMAQGLTQLEAGFSLGNAALETAINMIPDGEISETQVAALYAAAPNMRETLETLVNSYYAAATIKGTYASAKPAFAAVSPALEPIITQLGTISGALRLMADSLPSAEALPDAAQLQQLIGGITQLSAQYSAFDSGLQAYTGGVATLAAQGSAVSDGVAEVAGGIAEVTDGLAELADGAKKLDDETSKLPERIDEEIAKLTDGMSGEAAQPVSFADARNTNVASVQFVLRTSAVTAPTPPAPPITAAESETFWDRLWALFN